MKAVTIQHMIDNAIISALQQQIATLKAQQARPDPPAEERK
jgi:hypothetical protein